MGRSPCCEKKGLKKGTWTPEEDQILISYIQRHGHGNWRALPEQAGLLRCGKSCRLRWINYLRPDIKRGNFTKEEEDTIMKMHEVLGNRWSAIAAKLSGRTDNEIKNHWRTHLKKRLFKNTMKIDTNATNTYQIINNNSLKDDLKRRQPSHSSAIANKEPESKSESQVFTVTTNATSVTVLEDGIDHKNSELFKKKNSELFNEDFWADVLSESSFSLEVESGFEVQSLPAPSICDATTAWWPKDGDNLDYSWDNSLDSVYK